MLEGANATHLLKIRNSINLQLCTIKPAIDYIKKNNIECNFIIKTRHDLYGIGYEKIFDYFFSLEKKKADKMCVLSFFGNPVEKLYYLDHFVMGSRMEMLKFYDIPYCEVQHMYPEHYF